MKVFFTTFFSRREGIFFLHLEDRCFDVCFLLCAFWCVVLQDEVIYKGRFPERGVWVS